MFTRRCMTQLTQAARELNDIQAEVQKYFQAEVRIGTLQDNSFVIFFDGDDHEGVTRLSEAQPNWKGDSANGQYWIDPDTITLPLKTEG